MLSRDYIIPALAGRLGNNMFMIAHAYARGLEYNKQVVVARSQVVHEGNDYSQNIFRGIEFTDEFVDNNNYNPEIPSDDKHTIYSGYFQNEKYFKKYSETIKSLFGPPLEFVNKIREEIPFIFETEVTVINVRRGDYLSMPNHHPTISKEYICKALELVPCKQYLIASDDILWCKENLDLPNAIYIDEWCPHAQLWIMSLCHHFVISNSTFSWWAAYLSRHAGKKVIAPETWLIPEVQWPEVPCKDWTVLPTYCKNKCIYPIDVKQSNLKVLCFTTSYKRHKMLRGTIGDIKNQSYKNLFHSINITSDADDNTDYSIIYNDIQNVNIVYNKNKHQHFNYINSIISTDFNNYDLFVKIDDDDIYKKDYIKTIVDFFNNNPTVDIVSSKIKYQLNGDILRQVSASNLGGNPEGCEFNMPPTFAFNKKGLSYILEANRTYGYEDNMWRDSWCGNCNIAEINNQENIIWHIHGKNISTSSFLIKTANEEQI